MVIDEKITNQSVRKRFFDIPTIRYELAKRQLSFIGKVVKKSEDQIPTKILTAWYDNKRKPGAPLKNNNKNLTQNIRLIVPGAAKDGLLTTHHLGIPSTGRRLLETPNKKTRHTPLDLERRKTEPMVDANSTLITKSRRQGHAETFA